MSVAEIVEAFCLEVIDAIYNRGGSMTTNQVDNLYEAVLEIVRNCG